MQTTLSLFIFCQMFGTFVGAFTAIWSQVAYIRAMQDGTIDAAEQAHLRVIREGLRFGMTLILLSSLGLVIMAYVLHTSYQPAVTTNYWISIVLSLLIIGFSWAVSRHRVSFKFSSAAIFTAWWFLAYLTIGWLPTITFGAAIAFYVVATAIFYAVLTSVHFFALHKD